MKDQMYDFTMHRTTMSARFGEVDQIEFPTMTICAQEGMKISKLQKYGLVENKHLLQNRFFNKENPNYIGQPNQSLTQTFDELSYILNRDFVLKVSHQSFYDGQVHLKLGHNSIPPGKRSGVKQGDMPDYYQVEPIKTYLFGTCYKVQPINSGNWFNTHSVFITIKLLTDETNEIDKPKDFRIYLTSNDTWHGVTRNTWRRFNPTLKQLEMGRQHILSIKMVEKLYKEGTDDATSCFTDLLKSTANCSVMCDLQSYNDLSPCNTSEQQECMYQNWNWKHYCLKHKRIVLFYPTYRTARHISRNHTRVKIFFDAWETETMEEIDVISLPSLIGSIGGSLGMFFGFSITGYVLCLLDKCFNMISKE